jgi:hypothetical protein
MVKFQNAQPLQGFTTYRLTMDAPEPTMSQWNDSILQSKQTAEER